MAKYTTTLFLAAMVGFGCTIADEDRCPSGLYWDGDIMACRLIEDSPEGGLDAGDDGYLAPCSGAEECEDYAADYCLYDPTKPQEPGICVFQNCEAGTCPAESQCCDCSLFPATLCLPDVVLSDPVLEAACECTP